MFEGRRSKRPDQSAEVKVPENARTIDLPGTTLLPGLIDAHTHVLLHPYDEALWDDQVLKESLALRVCRATNHLRKTLASGFTTIRDLGTEGAGYADVGLKQAVARGLSPGRGWWLSHEPSSRRGAMHPKASLPELHIPQGAEEADGVDSLIRVVRRSDRSRGRLDQGLCGYRDGRRRGSAFILTGGTHPDCRYSTVIGCFGVCSCHVERGHEARGPWLVSRPSSMAMVGTSKSSN